MRIGRYRFDAVEFSGSLGDLGTLVPLSVALVTVNGLGFTQVFLVVGLFYLATGLYFNLPIPVQPLKVVAAIAIAFPEKITLPVMSAAGLLFGVILLVLALSGTIDWLSKVFTKPIVRGIQLGLGFMLIMKGIEFIQKPGLFIDAGAGTVSIGGVPLNLVIGLVGVAIVLLFTSSSRFPAALVIVGAGILVGIPFLPSSGFAWDVGPTAVQLYAPSLADYIAALVLLVIPQIPLTIGNAVIGTTDTARSLFGTGEATRRANNRSFAISMGLANVAAGALAAMPVCHGAGGLAAHYRFGARTGGSNIMIGVLLAVLAIACGKVGVTLVSAIPNAVLGVLLLFAGLELATLLHDVDKKEDLFIASFIAGIALATTNMSVAFGAGIVAGYLVKWGNARQRQGSVKEDFGIRDQNIEQEAEDE